ncbi:MAG: DsbA family protein [Alphaproteobacteria bacterium]|nr:DsbA family protein [Alphaproteobacteria bacterium]
MKITRLLLTSVSVACLLPMAAFAADANAPVTRSQFESILAETLDNNPEILVTAIKKLQAKQKAEGDSDAKEAIVKNKAALTKDASLPAIGASIKDADVTVVEFFDYHCGYCKHMVEPITKIVESDKKIRFVFLDFPILSEDSTLAAQAAIAVNRIDPKKYWAFHTAAMQQKGKFDDKALADLANSIGIKPEKLKAEMDKPETAAALQKNRALGSALGVRGTPALVVGDQFMPGALSMEELKATIERVRAANKKG